MAFPTTTYTDYSTLITASWLNAVNVVSNSLYGTNGLLGLLVDPVTDVVSLPTGQLKFPATQNPSSDANTLDDYEEGTWTPTISFATPGDSSIVLSTAVADYTKIGRQVTLHLNITTSTFTHTTAAGSLRIEGFPVDLRPSAGFDYTGSVRLRGYTNATYTQIEAGANSDRRYINLFGCGSGITPTALAPADLPTGGTVQIKATLTYFV